MEDQRLDISWESLAKVFVALAILYVIYLARTIALWFFFGLAIAVLLEPAIQFLRKFKVPKMVAIVVVYLAIFGILAVLIYLSAPIFLAELQQFAKYLPQYFNQINPVLKQLGVSAANNFDQFISGIVAKLSLSSDGLLKSLAAFFGGISATAFILTIAFFLSLEDRGPERFLSLVVPRKYEQQMVDLFERAQHKIAGWFGARILACLFVGIASFIVFYIFGLPYAFTLALISGVLNFIPYIGPWITTIIVLVMAAVTTGSWFVVLYVVVALTIVQEVENKLLTPLLMKRMIDVPPVVVLLSLLVGTEVFGFLGAIFAVPVFGILYEFVKEVLEKQKEESVKLMKKFYITTTLPYVNAPPHIGFALEMIQADVIARAARARDFEVFFNTGSDEHGLKILRQAEQAGMNPKAYCDMFAAKFADLKKALNLSYNNFIRTTDENHIKAAQEFWKRCYENGDIYKKTYQVKYCVGCELEKTDSELENGKCPLHPNLDIELIDEENYFFKYSNYQQKLLDFYGKNPDFVIPASRLKEISEFTKKGLEDFSISRLKEKMAWGVEVPGDSAHVMYVWFDALVSYIAALDWPEDEKKFKAFWPGLQMAGKDNLRQQSSMWQAMLMSAKLPNSKQIFIHGFITSGGQKMSKSLGNVVNPMDVVEKYGTDALRYYLLREITPTEDGDFTYEKFEQRYNADLAGGIGNLVARMFGIAGANWNGKKGSKKITREVEKAKEKVEATVAGFKFNDGLAAIWELISFCDKYINDEKLWQTKAPQAIDDIFFAIGEITRLLMPFLPETSEKIKKALEEKTSVILFPRIDAK